MAIAFVSTGSGNGSSASTTLALSAINLASGNFVCATFKSEGGVTLSSVADTAGNTYTLLTGTTYAVGDAALTGAYAMNTASHATNVVTGTFSGSASWRQGGCIQYSGVATTSALDVQGYNSATSGTAVSSGAVTTTQNDEVCVGFVGSYTGETYSSRLINGAAANTRVTGSDFAMWDTIVSATFSSGTAAVTQSASSHWACGIATFKAAASAAVKPKFLNLLGCGV